MEFQAVVMAVGKGSRMMDLTSNCSKALLPVANFPMVWYPLRLLQNAGFQEAIVITTEAARPKVKELASKLKLKLDIEAVPDEDWGTADSLRHIHEKLKADVLVISCDLITDVSLKHLTQLHRKHDASLTALLTPLPSGLQGAVVPGYKGKNTIEHDFIGLDPKACRLLFVSSEADLSEVLYIRKHLIQRYPHITVHSEVMDGHLYIMKKWVVDYLVQDVNMTSIKGEVVPFLIDNQFRSKTASSLGNENTRTSHKDGSVDIYSVSKEDPLLSTIRDMSSWNDHCGDMEPTYHGDQIRCYGCLIQDCYCVRANTIAAYMAANKKCLQNPEIFGLDIPSKRIDPTATCQPSQVDDVSLVGPSSCVAEKARIQASVIGANCNIGAKVRLVNCVVMNNVVIEEGAVLEGSIVAEGAVVEQNAVLRDSLVAASQRVSSAAKFTKEVIADADRMMEIE